ncbi:MAG: hypothetical protein MJZ12_00265 [Prevotella sp.]|nr:hypothetical protein [Prevotella sp.]
MNTYPKGNDLQVRWSLIYSDDTPFPLGSYDYELSYKTNRGSKVVTDTSVITIEDNILIWDFRAFSQSVSGVYSLGLKIFLAGSQVVELNYDNAFSLSAIKHASISGNVVNLTSVCDVIDVRDAVLQARHSLDLAASAEQKASASVETSNGAKAKAEDAVTIASGARLVADDALEKVSTAETAAQRAEVSAQSAAGSMATIQASLDQLSPDQSGALALAGTVNGHTEKLSELEGETQDIQWEIHGTKEFNNLTQAGVSYKFPLKEGNVYTFKNLGVSQKSIAVRTSADGDNIWSASVAPNSSVAYNATTGSDYVRIPAAGHFVIYKEESIKTNIDHLYENVTDLKKSIGEYKNTFTLTQAAKGVINVSFKAGDKIRIILSSSNEGHITISYDANNVYRLVDTYSPNASPFDITINRDCDALYLWNYTDSNNNIGVSVISNLSLGGIVLGEDIVSIKEKISPLVDNVFSGNAASAYGWVGDVSIPSGSRVINTGSINLNLYETKNTSARYVSLLVGSEIILPFNVQAIRAGSATGACSFKVAGVLNNLDTKVSIIEDKFAIPCLFNSVESLSNGETLSLTDSPQSIKIGDHISFEAKVSSWGNGVTIGKVGGQYASGYMDITPTECVLKQYITSESVVSRISHNLSISSFVKVVIDITDEKWVVIVQTLGGTFIHEFAMNNSRGSVRVTSNGASLTDVQLRYTNSTLNKPIWAFGDSYFGTLSTNREMYWIKEWGYLNFMIDGFAGAASSQMSTEVDRCLNLYTPKYIIWCLGMNDNAGLSAWRNFVTSLQAKCALKGISLILATIPVVRDSTTYKNKQEMTDWVRESGFRYVDVYKAVGADSLGHWYGDGTATDYQSTDNVHPTEYGAKTIATQFLVDVPEIMAE